MYRQAIKEVLEAGQSMMLDDGITYTRGNLRTLHDEERKLNRAIARLKRTVPMFQSVNLRGPYH